MADPLVVVIAGPNGAGKSTAAPRLLQEGLAVSEFVNADAVALGLSAFRPETAAVAAGRVMLARLKALAALVSTSPSKRRSRAGALLPARPITRVGLSRPHRVPLPA